MKRPAGCRVFHRMNLTEKGGLGHLGAIRRVWLGFARVGVRRDQTSGALPASTPPPAIPAKAYHLPANSPSSVEVTSKNSFAGGRSGGSRDLRGKDSSL